MEVWQALILGIVEGITEYLPVSSTGHLILAQRIMGDGTASTVDKLAADAFAISIQGGAILAVLGLYRKHVLKIIRGISGRDSDGLKLATNIIVGFVPSAIFGILLNDWIESKLFSEWPIIVAWVLGGIAILATCAWRRRNPTSGEGKNILQLTWKLALIIGLLQCIAMWPGTSRSLMTIVGGILVGLSVKAAVEYSFLLGVLTLSAATIKKALWGIDGAGPQYEVLFGGMRLMWEHYGPVSFLVGIIAAAISAAVAVKWLVSYLQSHGLEVFGYYRIALGLIVATLILTDIL